MQLIPNLLIWACFFKAASAYAVQRISFNKAIELTILNNLEVQASYETFKSSKLDKKITSAVYWPRLSAKLSYEKTNNEFQTGSTSTSDNYTAALNLNQNLFNGFHDNAEANLAQERIFLAEANLQETKAQVSFDLKNAIANYFYAKDSLTLSRDIKKRREDNLRMVELRFENGRENKGSVLLSSAYLEQAKLDLMKAENTMTSSILFVKRVLNLPENTAFEIIDLPPANPLLRDPNFSQIIENTPTAKRFRSSLASATSTLRLSKSGFYPSLDLSASLSKTGKRLFPDDNQTMAVGTFITWSFFDGGKNFYSVNSSSLLVKAAEKKLENQNLELRKVLTENYTAFAEAIATVKVSNAFLEAARVRADIARSKYNNGLTNFDDWDLIENELINRQKDYTLKFRDRLIAEASWEKVQGRGVIP